MNFKLKIILLILSISLIPYIFIMIYIGNTFQKTYYKNTQKEMQTQLKLSVDSIEQYLNTLQKDMEFMSKLDIMNDIYSKDIDKRISNLLIKKVKQLNLNGNLHVIDIKKTIIASSNSKEILTTYTQKPFFKQNIYSSFNHSKIGEIVLDFPLKNIISRLENSVDRHYYIVLKNKEILFKKESFQTKIDVNMPLHSKPDIKIVLEENQEKFLSLLHQYKLWFIFALIIGAIIISLIALYFINRLIKPIIQLSRITDKITKEQDYSYQIDIQSNDEIGILSNSFNKMITSMNNAMINLQNDAKNKESLIKEKSKNEMLKELSSKLSRYLSPQIYQSIFEGDQDVTLTSKRKKLTIFFSDIVDFTETTDSMESEDLSELLNDYLNEMTIIALKYGATVDKYIGDAIMLFFGDPYSKGVKEDALACVQMALEMHTAIDVLHKKWKEKGFTKPFKVRIGIHTGYCTVGNFGSNERLDYTIIGSSVNLASRIESAAIPNEILISEETKLLVEDTHQCIESKEIIPKGYKRPIALYSVKSTKRDTSQLHNNATLLKLSDIHIETLSKDEKLELKKNLLRLITNLS